MLNTSPGHVLDVVPDVLPVSDALPRGVAQPVFIREVVPNRRRAIPSVALDLERRGRHAEHEVGWELVFIAEMRDGQRALCVCAVAETRERQIGVRCEVGGGATVGVLKWESTPR